MSVSIATMGKFWPAGGTTIVKKIVDDGSSSGYGWEKPKPKIIVSSVSDDDSSDFVIRVDRIK